MACAWEAGEIRLHGAPLWAFSSAPPDPLAMTLNSLAVQPDAPRRSRVPRRATFGPSPVGARSGSRRGGASVRRRLTGRFVVALALLGTPATAGVGSASAALWARGSSARPAFRDGDGLRVLSEKQLDPRLLALTVSTPALDGQGSNPAVRGPANIRILLPSGYAQHPHRRYPVLYLLHGTSGGAADWTESGGRSPRLRVCP